MKWIQVIIISVFIIVISACGHEAIIDETNQMSQPPEEAQNLQEDPVDTNPPTNEEDPKIEQEDTSQQPEEEEELIEEESKLPIETKYYIADNYDIRPLEEGTDKNIVLLTFDDGPKGLELVEKTLDILDKHEAKAIFFVNGFRVKQNPDLLLKIHERGQIIGNHSWDHINLRDQDEQTVIQQITDVQQIVEELTGIRPQFFRPPFGVASESIRTFIKEQHMVYMNWSNGSLDWDSQHQTAEDVIANVMEQLRPGSNILMHELSWTMEALDELISRLSSEGYSIVDPRAIQGVSETSSPIPQVQ